MEPQIYNISINKAFTKIYKNALKIFENEINFESSNIAARLGYVNRVIEVGKISFVTF